MAAVGDFQWFRASLDDRTHEIHHIRAQHLVPHANGHETLARPLRGPELCSTLRDIDTRRLRRRCDQVRELAHTCLVTLVRNRRVIGGGFDIRDIALKSMRRQIGIVPQDCVLFSGTIAENIAFGQSNFDLDAVQQAAKIANAHNFISQFSQGYHTWVGERGVNLSGGQRQRVAIARAVLLDPKILILDEATSALDSESEALVQEALERLMRDRTVFIIAHRLATVRRADRIVVMERGTLIESGTHEELLARRERYAQFYAQQFKG